MAKRFPRKPEVAGRGFADPRLFGIDLGPLVSTWRSWLPKVVLIAGLISWIYWPALRGQFIWDDEWYVLLNPLLHDSTGLWKFWFRPGSWVEYYPLQETVLWLQWQLWGTHTLGYHLTNVFCHFVSALLVWRLLAKLGLRAAWLGGLLFAVHPVQVESVAYICESKNTLSLPFFLAALLAWIDYDDRRAPVDYGKALGFYLAAMLCKISMLPFPGLILLYAWWKRGTLAWAEVKACAPFAAISVILGFATVWAGITYEAASHLPPAPSPLDGFGSRLDAIGLIGAIYFARCFLPIDLLLAYPQWELKPHDSAQYLPWLALLFAGLVLGWRRATWGRHAILGLGFFFIFLSPFLGLTAVSYMSFAWAMDHFLYLPIIGLIGLAVAAVGRIAAASGPASRLVLTGLLAVTIALLSLTSRSFAALFVNGETFWTYLTERNPGSWLAQMNLGCRLLELDRPREAAVHLGYSIQIRPDSYDGYYNQGIALAKLGQIPAAEKRYNEALKLYPENPAVYLNLGELKRKAGDLTQAEALFRQGLKWEPAHASLNTNLGGILLQTGRIPEAIALYEHAIADNPDLAQLQYDLGSALLRTGALPDAAEHLARAVELDPKLAAAHATYGAVLAQMGRLPEAIDQFQTALELDPNVRDTRDNLGLALAQSGRIPEAIAQFQKELDDHPDDAQARASLDKLRQYEIQSAPPAQH